MIEEGETIRFTESPLLVMASFVIVSVTSCVTLSGLIVNSVEFVLPVRSFVGLDNVKAVMNESDNTSIESTANVAMKPVKSFLEVILCCNFAITIVFKCFVWTFS